MNMVYAMLPTSPSTGPQKSLVGGLGQIGSRNYIGLLTHTGLVRQFQVGYLMDFMIYLGEEDHARMPDLSFRQTEKAGLYVVATRLWPIHLLTYSMVLPHGRARKIHGYSMQ